MISTLLWIVGIHILLCLLVTAEQPLNPGQQMLERLLRSKQGQRLLVYRIPELEFFEWSSQDVYCGDQRTRKSCFVRATLNYKRILQEESFCVRKKKRNCLSRYITDLEVYNEERVILKFTHSSRFYSLHHARDLLDPKFVEVHQEIYANSYLPDPRETVIPDEFVLAQASYDAHKLVHEGPSRTPRYYAFFMEREAALTLVDILMESGKSDHYYIVHMIQDFPNAERVGQFIAKVNENPKPETILSVKDGVCITKQLLQALDQVHKNQFAHNAISYDNVLISANPDPSTNCRYSILLMDFGYAYTHASPVVPAHLLHGLPKIFAPPEVIEVRENYLAIINVIRKPMFFSSQTGTLCLRLCNIVSRMILLGSDVDNLDDVCRMYRAREKECVFAIFQPTFARLFVNQGGYYSQNNFDSFFNNVNVAIAPFPMNGMAIDLFAAGALLYSIFTHTLLVEPLVDLMTRNSQELLIYPDVCELLVKFYQKEKLMGPPKVYCKTLRRLTRKQAECRMSQVESRDALLSCESSANFHSTLAEDHA